MGKTKSPFVITTQLSIMMFLQFFIWGAWYVSAPKFLGTIGFGPSDFGWTYSVGPIAGILSPFIVGIIADRFFSTEKVLAVMHLCAGGMMFFATSMMQGKADPDVINIIFFIHMLFYFPTLALTNSLAMHTMTDPEKQFPLVRVFGTIGWIVAGLLIGKLLIIDSVSGSISPFFGDVIPDGKLSLAQTSAQFQFAGGAAILLGIFSFFLPHVPPPSAGQKVNLTELIGADAFSLLKNRSFLIFMISSFLICIPLAFYYQLAERAVTQTGIESPTFKMTFGQMSEILFMLLMPLFFKRLGVKWMLFVGMLCWVIRYGLFAVGAPDSVHWMMIVGIMLHGICYDFFFVTGQIYTDKIAPKHLRSQAQGMLVLFTLGLGMLIGAQCASRIEVLATPKESIAMTDKATALSVEIESLNASLETATGEEKTTIEAQIVSKTNEKSEAAMQALKLKDWRYIWGIPGIFAAIVLIIFTILFKDETKNVPEEMLIADAQE